MILFMHGSWNDTVIEMKDVLVPARGKEEVGQEGSDCGYKVQNKGFLW